MTAGLEIIWSTPITTQIAPQGQFGRSEGLVLTASAVSQDGSITFLGEMLSLQHSVRVLIRDAEKLGPLSALPLELTAPEPSASKSVAAWSQKSNSVPTTESLALAPEGEIWLGGDAHRYIDFSSTTRCDAYLAKIGAPQKPIWERTYRGGVCPSIESIIPVAGGVLVTIGRDGWSSSWMARIADDGTLLGENHFGSGNGAVAVQLRDGEVLIVGIGSSSEGGAYHEDVSTWLLDKAGAMRGPTRIRDAINRFSGSRFGRLGASVVGDGAYIVSNWSDPFLHPQPVEVARVGFDGAPLWNRGLPDTIQAKQTRTETCDPALATLPNGDALVACALNGEIQLYRLRQESGEQQTVRLPLPACQRAHSAALLLMVRPDGTVFLSGSRPRNNVGGSCSWLGRLVLQ